MFGMLLEKIMLPDVQKVTGNINKKITAVGIIKVLTDTQKLIDGPYAQFWYVLFKIIYEIDNINMLLLVYSVVSKFLKY